MSIKERPYGQWTSSWSGYRTGATLVGATDVAMLDLVQSQAASTLTVDDSDPWTGVTPSTGSIAVLPPLLAAILGLADRDDLPQLSAPSTNLTDDDAGWSQPVLSRVALVARLLAYTDDLSFAPAGPAFDEDYWSRLWAWPVFPPRTAPQSSGDEDATQLVPAPVALSDQLLVSVDSSGPLVVDVRGLR